MDFVGGFEMAVPYGHPRSFCIPAGVSVRQYIDVLVAYLTAHPERRQVTWYLLFLHALNEAWPCRDGVKIEWLPSEQTIRMVPPSTRR